MLNTSSARCVELSLNDKSMTDAFSLFNETDRLDEQELTALYRLDLPTYNVYASPSRNWVLYG